jgi:hypothetical protein
MDDPGGHYDKWNKLGKERQMLSDITYMWDFKMLKNVAGCQGLRGLEGR